MKQLRQQMIDAMLMRGFSARTHQSYLYAVVKLVKYYHRAPDQLTSEEIQQFFLHLVKDLHLTGASCRLYFNGPSYRWRTPSVTGRARQRRQG